MPSNLSNQRRNKPRAVTTFNGLAKLIRKEMAALHHLVETRLENRTAPASLVSSSPYPPPTCNTKFFAPIAAAGEPKYTLKGKVLKGIELHLLFDARAGCTELSLNKVKNGASMTANERKANSVYKLLSIWAKNIADSEAGITGVVCRFAKLDDAKRQELIGDLEDIGAKYGIHIGRSYKSWMARYFLTIKFGAASDELVRQQKANLVEGALEESDTDQDASGDDLGDDSDAFDESSGSVVGQPAQRDRFASGSESTEEDDESDDEQLQAPPPPPSAPAASPLPASSNHTKKTYDNCLSRMTQ
ncbi:hypothetical protein [Absidia glauca]|uniref:Uncharacterized protein n=1 Tax=Absidia glauca TaxID=4829 RepID=A0A168PI08_ABSGL|nr:hypothetical protein [Absidia glauca]